MKVALVYPRIKDRDLTPPLGLLYLASYAKAYGSSAEIKIFDNNFDDIESSVVKYSPDIIGITAMTIDYTEALRLATFFKDKLNVPIIIGGIHISSVPETLADPFVIGVVGEGEATFLEVLLLFEKKSNFETNELQKIKGIAFHANGKVHVTEKRAMIDPLDMIPMVDRDLLHKEYFHKKIIPHIAKHGIEGTILTARGCPYNCVFCSTKAFWKIVRFHSAKRVYDEIRIMAEKYSVTHITIWDDLFTAHIPRLKELSSMLKQDDLTNNITFSCQARTNQINDSLCQILKELNVKQVSFGFESGSEKMLRYLKRETVSVEQNRQAILKCKEYSFRVYGSLIFGSPTETIDDMKETVEFIRFAKKNGADALWAFIMTPFPETEMWKIAVQRGKVSENMNWDLLSHQNLDNPLMLDPEIDKEAFKKVFLTAREELNYFRRKYIKDNIRNSFFDTMLTAATHPSDTFKTIRGVLSKNRIPIQK